MGYQYGHADSFARTAGKGKEGNHTISSIVDEAERKEGSCDHVEHPELPILLFGIAPSEAKKEAEKWADSAKDARGHKLRKDALCMIGGVISVPDGFTDWDKYKTDAIEWLKKKYGTCLKSVVEHIDEPYPHFHFYVVPEKGLPFDSIHDGLKASKKADPHRGDRKRSKEESGDMRARAKHSYKKAMSAWQDDLHKSVSKKYGLLRYGPRREKLTRKEVNARTETMKEISSIKKDLDRREKVVTQKENWVKRAIDIHEKKFGKEEFGVSIKLSKYFHGLDRPEMDALNLKFIELGDQKRAEKNRSLGGKSNEISQNEEIVRSGKGGR